MRSSCPALFAALLVTVVTVGASPVAAQQFRWPWEPPPQPQLPPGPPASQQQRPQGAAPGQMPGQVPGGPPPGVNVPQQWRPPAAGVQRDELPPLPSRPGSAATPTPQIIQPAPAPSGPTALPGAAPPPSGPAPGAGTAAVPGTGPVLPGLPPGQRQPRGTPQPATPGAPADEVVVAPPAQRIANPTAVFTGLDKITGRTITFDVAINETVQFGALQVTPRTCFTRPPTETPQTTSFIEVQEVTLRGDMRRLFNGWMFAASPGLNAVEHPIYDVWLVDCKQAPPNTSAAVEQGRRSQSTPPAAAPPAPAPAPR